jgi:hypothetical protein
VRAEPKSLATFLGVVKSLGMSDANMVEYSSESAEDEEADMCVAKWSWGSKYKPFVCSSLKLASKSQQDKMCYTFNVAKCDRIFDYLLQEK